MNKNELVRHVTRASYRELIENIAAGPGDQMAFRYHLSQQEIERRNKRIPLLISVGALVVSGVSLVLSVAL